MRTRFIYIAKIHNSMRLEMGINPLTETLGDSSQTRINNNTEICNCQYSEQVYRQI